MRETYYVGMSFSTFCLESNLSFFMWTISVSSISDLKLIRSWQTLKTKCAMTCQNVMTENKVVYFETSGTVKAWKDLLTSDSLLNFLKSSSFSNFSR